MLTTQADRFSREEVHRLFPCGPIESSFNADMHVCFCPLVAAQMEQMFTAFPPDVAGNLDYKNLVHIITHGEEKDQE